MMCPAPARTMSACCNLYAQSLVKTYNVLSQVDWHILYLSDQMYGSMEKQRERS